MTVLLYCVKIIETVLTVNPRVGVVSKIRYGRPLPSLLPGKADVLQLSPEGVDSILTFDFSSQGNSFI